MFTAPVTGLRLRRSGPHGRSTRPDGARCGLLSPLGAIAAALLLCLTLLPSAVLADAGRWIGSASYGELRQELATLQGSDGLPIPSLDQAGRQRLVDLTELEQAIAASDDRSQVSNAASHQLGLYTLSKKAVPGTPAEFAVLAPGHATDDDVAVLGLFVPAGVSLQWGDGGLAVAASEPRVLRLPDGEVLSVSEGDASAGVTATPDVQAADAGSLSYRLSLPPFALEQGLPDQAALPRLSQAELDAQPETAPID